MKSCLGAHQQDPALVGELIQMIRLTKKRQKFPFGRALTLGLSRYLPNLRISLWSPWWMSQRFELWVIPLREVCTDADSQKGLGKWTQTLTPFGIRHWDSPKALIILREHAAKSLSSWVRTLGLGQFVYVWTCMFGHGFCKLWEYFSWTRTLPKQRVRLLELRA